jgi:hypothetical protein
MVVEERFSHCLPLSNRHRRQVQTVGRVTDGVDAGHTRAGIYVHHYGAGRIELDAGGLETQTCSARFPARGKHDVVHVHKGPVRERRTHPGALSLDLHDVALEAYIYALAPHLVGQGAAHVIVEAAQERRAAVQLGDLGADAVEDPGELHSDVSAADDEDALGCAFEKEGFVGGDGELDAGNTRPHGPSARGD